MNTRVFFTLKAGLMKHGIFITLCCICCTLLVSCKDIECTGFPKHLLDYFPYQIDDTLSFVNQHNDTLSFLLNDKFITEDWSYEYWSDCTCDGPFSHFGAIQITEPKYTTSLRIVISVGSKYTKPYITFEFDDDTTLKSSYLYFYDDTGKDAFDPKNSLLFGETVIIENMEMQISQVIIIWGKGITEFFDQKHNFQWISIK